MKKTMYKLGMVAILGLGLLANAQVREGVVGVNTEAPQATLDIQPSTTNANGTTNEGIIAPKLTKERVANIATPVEGTLVYVTNATYSGSNAAVAKIDDKGYYYFDGTVWVKAKGAAAQTVGAINGLSKTGDNIELGGALTKATNIDQAGNNLTTTGKGNVGIGTDNPTEKLEVEGAVKSNYAVKISRNESEAGPYLELKNPLKTEEGTAERWRIYNMTGAYTNSLQFWAYDKGNLGSKMILTDKGKLGLGVPSKYDPTHTLELRGGDASLTSKNAPLMIGQYEATNIAIDSNELMARVNGEASILYINADGGDVWINSNAEQEEDRFYFREGKGLGLGVGNPTAKLDVNGDVRIRTIADGDTASDYVLLADADGNVKKAAAGSLGATYTGSTSIVLKGNSFERAALTGDVTSAQNSNEVTVNAIQGKSISDATPTDGQVLQWENNAWTPASVNTENLYTNDGTLTGDRTVNLANHSLILGTGGDNAGKVEINGTKVTKGAVYVNMDGDTPNFRTWDKNKMPEIKSYDYMIIFTNNEMNGKLTLPLASESKGRILHYINGTLGGLTFLPTDDDNVITPFNYTVLNAKSSCDFISDGIKWYPLGR